MKAAFIAFTALVSLSMIAHGHGIASLGDRPVDWPAEHISRVIAEANTREVGQVVTLDGKRCLEGMGFRFDVDDRYAFDIDETVQVEVEFYRHAEAAMPEMSYEKNGESEATLRGRIPAFEGGQRTYKETFLLERARFANRGLFLTDFSIGLGMAGFTSPQKITICNVSLKRSYATVVPKVFGTIALEVVDETGKRVPARVGIYDHTGRFPLPSRDAVAVKRFDEMIRVVNISPSLIPWPAHNHSGFYVNGLYRAQLPTGEYDLVVAKGPEYRFFRQKFEVESARTQTIKVKLTRWDNLPAKGWYSGDNHIHYIRHDARDDPSLLLFTQAEDVHVANILQMGNMAAVTWPQYGWRPVIAVTNTSYSLVPGQEDPRTRRRGHTISLHLKEPIRDPQHYLLYHEVFKQAHAQGGVTGYAHLVGPDWGNATGGLAVDVPFGLVDFVEVMQFGLGGSSVWFDFLNLGYKLAPSAGTDYMTDMTLPGAERSYVYVPKSFSLQAWFDALRRGETFVTNGPMLTFTVNGQGMGSELRLKSGDKLVIDAAASVNPDIDSMASLELIEQGEVVKTVSAEKAGEERLQLHYEVTAKHGTWFVVRARGKLPVNALIPGREEWEAHQGSAKIALSGAVYVYVDGQSFWKPAAVPAIVQRLKQNIERVMAPETGDAAEWGERETVLRLWGSQEAPLRQRIDQVMPIYDDLVAKARMATAKH